MIEKLCLTKIDIFCPQEANDKINDRYDGAFLSVVKEKNGFRFSKKRPLPLYAYGEDKKQMITIPRFLLNVPALSNTNENILLKQYLIHELELVRNKRNNVSEKTFRILDYKHTQLLSWSSEEQTGYLTAPVEFHDEDFSVYVSQDMLCPDPMKFQK